MKTKQFIRFCFAAACFSLLFACKKETTASSTAPATSDLQTSSDDQAMASGENDAVSNDITVALTSNTAFSRVFADGSTGADATMRVQGDSAICDATLSFDTTAATKLLTITYNGTNCRGNRTRTGTVIISEPKGMHWGDKGATVTIALQNLVITRLSDGKSIAINGIKKITNTSGGLLFNLAALGTIIHDISDSLSISCDRGTVRTWNASRHRVFVYDNGIKMTTTGTHSDGVHNDIAEWGINRFGVNYSCRITVPKIITQACGFRLVKGQDTFTRGDNFSAVVSYGLDANGLPLTTCPAGNFYAQVAWTYIPTGKMGSFLFSY